MKVPKAITHDRGLVDAETLFRAFAEEVAGLSGKLEAVLVQLPPKLAFDADIARGFFGHACSVLAAAVVVEPRHASWFTPDADGLLKRLRVARVAAHPVLHGDGEPGGWDGLMYYRLHGAPRTYYSDYDEAALDRIAEQLGRSPSFQMVYFRQHRGRRGAGKRPVDRRTPVRRRKVQDLADS